MRKQKTETKQQFDFQLQTIQTEYKQEMNRSFKNRNFINFMNFINFQLIKTNVIFGYNNWKEKKDEWESKKIHF